MKAIVFDFDGTLSKKGKSSWCKLWEHLGYPTDKTSSYAKLYFAFMKGAITHQEWCNYTCNYFKKAQLTKSDVLNMAKQTQMMPGFSETINKLKENGYNLYIVSGGVINMIIPLIILANANKFNGIYANKLEFDENGVISYIKGTPYDFEGKATFVKKLINDGYEPGNITFVGNSDNDEFVKSVGVKTICLNAYLTDPNNKQKWDNAVNTSDLRTLLPYLIKDNQIEKSK